jgi:hypothetical protein
MGPTKLFRYTVGMVPASGTGPSGYLLYVGNVGGGTPYDLRPLLCTTYANGVLAWALSPHHRTGYYLPAPHPDANASNSTDPYCCSVLTSSRTLSFSTQDGHTFLFRRCQMAPGTSRAHARAATSGDQPMSLSSFVIFHNKVSPSVTVGVPARATPGTIQSAFGPGDHSQLDELTRQGCPFLLMETGTLLSVKPARSGPSVTENSMGATIGSYCVLRGCGLSTWQIVGPTGRLRFTT